nr:lasso peptide biosynthesis B2 protein [Sphingobium lignivorans]
MSFHISDDISWCVCAGQAVFLDLRRDRYVRLRPEQNALFLQWANTGTEPKELDRLAGCGLLTAGAPRPPTAVSYPLPVRDAGADLPRAVRSFDIGRAFLAWRRSSASLRRRHLADIVREMEADTGTVPGTVDAEARITRIAAAFASTALSFRKADQCLPRALAAWALCRRVGVSPAIVFGVRLEPFAAHCWVQWNDAVVVGGLEEARMFTPIRVIS